MVYSMTGFSRLEVAEDLGHFYWEIRSVNHRFLEVNFRLPEGFLELESALRDKIKQIFSRGKLDITLKHAAGALPAATVSLNRQLLKQLIQAHTDVAILLSDAGPISPLELMRWPGVVTMAEHNLEKIKPILLSSFDTALQSLNQSRQREGQALLLLIDQRLQQMQQYVQQLIHLLPQMIAQHRIKLLQRIEQLGVDFEPQRVEQEVVLLAQRADIAEEIERLAIHIAETQQHLHQGGVLGRRLDFLLQEMQREANTLGSKASDMQITHIAVELKVLIEQIREQIQNIE